MSIDVTALPGIDAQPIDASVVIKLAMAKSTMSKYLLFNWAMNITATIWYMAAASMFMTAPMGNINLAILSPILFFSIMHICVLGKAAELLFYKNRNCK